MSDETTPSATTNVLPWSSAGDFAGWAIGKAAGTFVGGVAGIGVGLLMDAIGMAEPTAQELLEQAVERFAEKVEAAIQRDNLRDAQAHFAALIVGMRDIRNEVKREGSEWWADDFVKERLGHLDRDARLLVETLGTLQVPGWEMYMLAAGLRLKVLATLMDIPGRDERDNIIDAVTTYERHNWDMAKELMHQVWPSYREAIHHEGRWHDSMYGGSFVDLTYGYGEHVQRYRKAFLFVIDKKEIGNHLERIGVQRDVWLTKMREVVRETQPQSDRTAILRPGFGPFEAQPESADSLCQRARDKCICFIGEDWGSEKQIKDTLAQSRDEFMRWIWTKYRTAFVDQHNNLIRQWWQDADPSRVSGLRFYDPLEHH